MRRPSPYMFHIAKAFQKQIVCTVWYYTSVRPFIFYRPSVPKTLLSFPHNDPSMMRVVHSMNMNVIQSRICFPIFSRWRTKMRGGLCLPLRHGRPELVNTTRSIYTRAFTLDGTNGSHTHIKDWWRRFNIQQPRSRTYRDRIEKYIASPDCMDSSEDEVGYISLSLACLLRRPATERERDPILLISWHRSCLLPFGPRSCWPRLSLLYFGQTCPCTHYIYILAHFNRIPSQLDY